MRSSSPSTAGASSRARALRRRRRSCCVCAAIARARSAGTRRRSSSIAQLLLEQGRIDEAEKYALAARETVSAEDTVSRATTRVALAQVRAAQGRHDEAEALFAEALEIVGGAEHCRILLDVLPPYADFLRALERPAEAA